MFGRLGGSPDPSDASNAGTIRAPEAAETRFSLVELRKLHKQLEENKQVNENNESLVIEILRVVAEMVVYGDKKSELLFDFFCEKNMLSLFLEIMNNDSESGGCPSAVHIQILQTLSILISCVRNDTSLYYLLSNNYINEIILFPHDFAGDESLCAQFASFMKSLSLKLNSQTVQFFFIEDTGAFPILTRAVELLTIPDPMIRIASQSTILNVYRVEDTRARAYALQDEVMGVLFAQVIAFMETQYNALMRICREYITASGDHQGMSDNHHHHDPAGAVTPDPNSAGSRTISTVDEKLLSRLEMKLDDTLSALDDWLYYLDDLLNLDVAVFRKALIRQLFHYFIAPILLGPLVDAYKRHHTRDPAARTMAEEVALNISLCYFLQMVKIVQHDALHRAVLSTLYHPLSEESRLVLLSNSSNGKSIIDCNDAQSLLTTLKENPIKTAWDNMHTLISTNPSDLSSSNSNSMHLQQLQQLLVVKSYIDHLMLGKVKVVAAAMGSDIVGDDVINNTSDQVFRMDDHAVSPGRSSNERSLSGGNGNGYGSIMVGMQQMEKSIISYQVNENYVNGGRIESGESDNDETNDNTKQKNGELTGKEAAAIVPVTPMRAVRDPHWDAVLLLQTLTVLPPRLVSPTLPPPPPPPSVTNVDATAVGYISSLAIKSSSSNSHSSATIVGRRLAFQDDEIEKEEARGKGESQLQNGVNCVDDGDNNTASKGDGIMEIKEGGRQKENAGEDVRSGGDGGDGVDNDISNHDGNGAFQEAQTTVVEVDAVSLSLMSSSSSSSSTARRNDSENGNDGVGLSNDNNVGRRSRIGRNDMLVPTESTLVQASRSFRSRVEQLPLQTLMRLEDHLQDLLHLVNSSSTKGVKKNDSAESSSSSSSSSSVVLVEGDSAVANADCMKELTEITRRLSIQSMIQLLTNSSKYSIIAIQVTAHTVFSLSNLILNAAVACSSSSYLSSSPLDELQQLLEFIATEIRKVTRFLATSLQRRIKSVKYNNSGNNNNNNNNNDSSSSSGKNENHHALGEALYLFKEEMKRFRGLSSGAAGAGVAHANKKKWRQCFDKMCTDLLLFLPITRLNVGRRTPDINGGLSPSSSPPSSSSSSSSQQPCEVTDNVSSLRHEIHTFLLLRALYKHLQHGVLIKFPLLMPVPSIAAESTTTTTTTLVSSNTNPKTNASAAFNNMMTKSNTRASAATTAAAASAAVSAITEVSSDDLVASITDKSFLSLEAENLLFKPLAPGAAYDMRGKRFLDVKIVPYSFTAAAQQNGVPQNGHDSSSTPPSLEMSTGKMSSYTNSSYASPIYTGNDSGAGDGTSSGGIGLVSGLSSLLGVNSRRLFGGNSSTTSSSGGGGGGTSPTPTAAGTGASGKMDEGSSSSTADTSGSLLVSSKLKILFVQDPDCLVLVACDKYDTRVGFKLLVAAPLLYTDAEVDPMDHTKFRVIVRSEEEVPHMHSSATRPAPLPSPPPPPPLSNAPTPPPPVPQPPHVQRSSSISSTGTSAYTASLAFQTISRCQPHGAGGAPESKVFVAAAEPSTYWQVTLKVDNEQACRLAVQHIQARCKDFVAAKTERLQSILRHWASDRETLAKED